MSTIITPDKQLHCGLHVHGSGSILDGYSPVATIPAHVAKIGQPAVALTDHAQVSDHLAFAKACKEFGVHGVHGMEGYWTFDIQAARDSGSRDNSHICLLAQNNEGLSNLWAWSSMAYEQKYFYRKPLADPDLMRQYSKGLYASDGCMLTEFGRSAIVDDEQRCREIYGTLLSIFGERFYVELHTWTLLDPESEKDYLLNDQMRKVNAAKHRLATEMGIPMVIVNDAHYTAKEDWRLHRLVNDMTMGGNDPDKIEKRGQAADWLMTEDEIRGFMAGYGIPSKDVEECFKNSYDIAMSCQVEITKTMDMPRVTASEAEDVELFMRDVQAGFERKVLGSGVDEEVYFERLQEECSLILDKGFSSYFNVVRDMVVAIRDGSYIQWVKPGSPKTPQLCGTGRGSAGGSLVSYLLDITTLDPIKYGLLFSRFLTPDRADWPDVDTDVPQQARPDAKAYLAARHAHTCAIGTRIRSGPKATLRDLCSVFDIPWKDRTAMANVIDKVNDLLKEVTGDEEMDAAAEVSWEEVLANSPELSKWAQQYPELFELMNRMVGYSKTTGVHAAGMLIANTGFLGKLPTMRKPGGTGTLTTQFDMKEVEEMGAVKQDLLGIRHLDTLMVAREMVYERHGVWLDYDNTGYGTPEDCPPDMVLHFGDEELNDPNIWAEVDRGHTLGVFQLETANGVKASRDFKPRGPVDLCDLVSVNRPGVIGAGLLDHFMDRREGIEAVSFDHPLMERITGPLSPVGNTHGILVYQEQLMLATEVLAGFSKVESDKVRKMVGKKQLDKMIAMEGEFISRCLANPEFIAPFASSKDPEQRAQAVADKVWKSLLASGQYAFNRSHGMGYGLVSNWEIWLRYYFFLESLTALMATDPKKITAYVTEARRNDVKVLPPHINESRARFKVEGTDIRYGLEAIASVGSAASTAIMAGQPYADFDDFFERAGAGSNKGVGFNLIEIGAFDDWDDRRSLVKRFEYLRAREDVLKTAKDPDKLTEQAIEQRIEKRLESKKWQIEPGNYDDPKALYQIEKRLVGNYIAHDPMEKFYAMIETHCVTDPDVIERATKGTRLAVGGQVVRVKEISIKKQGANFGKKMAFVTIVYDGQEYEFTAFPEAWAENRSYLHDEAPVVCNCVRDAKGMNLSSVVRLDWMQGEHSNA